MFSRLVQKAQRPMVGTTMNRINGVAPMRILSVHSPGQTQMMWPMRYKSSMTEQDSSISSQPKDLFDLGTQLERQQQIKENIIKAKKEIVEKQSEGLNLALKVSREQANLNEHIEGMDQDEVNSHTQISKDQTEYFDRRQRYEIFVEKMHQLYKYDRRVREKRNKALAAMQYAPVHSMKPLKTILSEYAKVSTSGFSCEVLAESLKRLNQATAALGNHPVSVNDYTMTEMDQSWRLDKVTEDIKFGLDPNPNVFFSPYNMAKVARNLGEIGYKNTEVMPLWFDKIDAMLGKPTNQDYIDGADVSFSQAQFGGLKNFKPRHYIYQGFDGNREFREHVQTLVDYEETKQKRIEKQVKESKGGEDYKNVLRSALKLIDAAEEVKDMQQEMQAAVRNIRTQYAKIKKAHDENEFLQESEYIQLDLLELQEMLIKAGYLSPEERVINDDLQQGALGMDAAVEVFYNMVLSNHPEALSPQYQAFIDASNQKSELSAANGDRFAEMRLHTLSSILVGIEKQALSYRRDISDKDYPTEFYEKLLNPEDEWLAKQEEVMSRDLWKLAQKFTTTHVQMERTHLNGWRTFYERTADIPAHMQQLLKRDDLGKEDIFSAFRALNVCKFQAQELRKQIAKKFNTMVNNHQNCDIQSLVDGIVGIAGCSYKPKNASAMVQDIVRQLSITDSKLGIKKIDSLTFMQRLEVLQGLTTPGIPELFQPRKKNQAKVVSEAKSRQAYLDCIQSVCESIDSMGFDMISHEMRLDELKILHQGYVNLKYSADKGLRDIWAKSFTNDNVIGAVEHIEATLTAYQESQAAAYDPLKPKVMAGLTDSLVKSNMRDLHVMQTNETTRMHKNMFPFAPDLLLGYEGQKVGIFVLNNDSVMRDTNEPCGFTKGKMLLVESAHKLADKMGMSQIKNICLPVRRVVDADLKEHKLELREDFDLSVFLKESGLNKHIEKQRIDTNELTDFSVRLAQQIEQNYNKTTAKLEEFCTQLLHVLRKRESMDKVYEQEQVLASIDEIKLQMLKLVMVHDTSLDKLEKQIVKGCLPSNAKSFRHFIQKGLVKPINATQDKVRKQLKASPESSHFWQGVRMEVELPQLNKSSKTEEDLQPKSILPELLNQKFLWHESYHHYGDWESKMKDSYDQFNLLELPQKGGKDAATLYFDPVNFNRRIPNGIFPDAKSPRTVLMPPGSELQSVSEREARSKLDAMTRFERSPLETMVNGELQRNNEVSHQELSSEMKTITNLQSIKHSLKSDLTDGEICAMLFDNLSFTEKLIEAHLNQAKTQGSAVFVERDAEAYRQFLNKQGGGLVAPFDHFYMKEAARRGNPEEIAQQIIELQNEHPRRPQEELDAKLSELYKKLEDLLQNYKRANEDQWNLSKTLGSTVEVTIDVNDFAAVQKRNDLGLTQTDLEVAPELFLNRQRCRAEANLIKARITYKVHNDIALSPNETAYLNAWMDKSSQTEALLPQADVMVPEEPSRLTLAESLKAEDFYALNSLSRVSIEGDQRNDIALNDLVLELNHFIDPETIRKVELGFLEENLRKEWRLADDFNLVEKRNKEIDLVMREMEELSWRAADMFDGEERKHLEDITFFDRGLDAFENSFLDMDRESFNNFFNEANSFDSRQVLLENWLVRKGEEIKNRVNLPPPNMAKSDQALYEKYDAPLKSARENLTSQMLTNDEFGNQNAKKSYSQLTSRELHLLSESLCVRLNLFQKKYPAFLPQVIKAIQEHPNQPNSDYKQLDAYCKLFELDWRGDAALENREQFMMSNPVYLNARDNTMLTREPITNKSVFKQIRQACQPFLPDLLSKMKKLGGK